MCIHPPEGKDALSAGGGSVPVKTCTPRSALPQLLSGWWPRASTPPCPQVVEGVNDTQENLLAAIARNEFEISPSSLFAVACIEEKVAFINGSPQNTFVPGEPRRAWGG